jgi:hypothetical protein
LKNANICVIIFLSLTANSKVLALDTYILLLNVFNVLAAELHRFCSNLSDRGRNKNMDKFNIAEYITITKKGLVSLSGQGPAGIAFMESVGSLLNPQIFYDDTKISRLVKHTCDAPNEMVTASSNTDFVRDVIANIKNDIEKDFNKSTIDNVCLRLNRLIQSEPNLATKYKQEIKTAYDSRNWCVFLGLSLIHAISMSNTDEGKETIPSEIPYLTEAHNHCPLCAGSLFRKSKGKNIPYYEITQIVSSEMDEDTKIELNKVYPIPSESMITSTDNTIALCLNCFSDYRADPTPEKYKELYEKKRDFRKEFEIESDLNEIDVEYELFSIINSLGELTKNEEAGLIPLDPKKLIEKIPDDVTLKDDVTRYVLKYYMYIEKKFSDIDSNGTSRFKVIAHQIGQAFETLNSRRDMNQKEIFNYLSKWIAEQINYPINKISVVNIIVAFFVQNCEVFHAIS